jgi:hypothetical protein
MPITDTTELPDADFDDGAADDACWSLDDDGVDDWVLLRSAWSADRDAIDC